MRRADLVEILLKQNEELLQTIQELNAQIIQMSQLMSKAAPPPMQVVPTSYQPEDGWNENPDYEELQQLRKSKTEETIAELQSTLADNDFLNSEITFDN